MPTEPAGEDAPPGGREVVAALLALSVTGLVAAGWCLGFRLDNAHNALLAVSFTAVGLYVLRMRPRHREALLFTAVGVVHAVMFFGRQYGSHGAPLPGADWIGWLGVWPLSFAIALAGWALIAFPHGRLLSPTWRVAAAAMLAIGAGLSVISALWPVDYDRTGVVAPHPLDLPGASTAADLWRLTPVVYAVFQVLWTVAVVARLRAARGDEVRQMRWLVYAVLIDITLLGGGLALLGSPVPGLLALAMVPIAAGIAILKYRLYDIDPVINKTIVIGAMVLVITAGYVGVVLGVGVLAPGGRGVLWLIATALVAVAAEPLRRRAQRLADRIVYGRRTTPYEALAQLTAGFDGEPDELFAGIATTVASAVGAREVVVWIGDQDRLVAAAAVPAPVDGAARSLDEVVAEGLHVRLVANRGAIVGALAVRKAAGEALTDVEDRLLSDLAAQTALVIVHQRQSEELQAAARRIVAAEDAARRRIERDLHDGAQQRLVTLGLELGVLAERARDPSLAAHAREVRAQLLDATSELRELARGLYPMVLTEQGLPAALEALADRSSVRVKLSVALDGRLSPDLEAATYFLVSEALTNATRHAAATVASVCVAKVEGGVSVVVADDGRGGATWSEGGGIQGVADRLAALGARLQLESPAGRGTRISTVLPCA